MHRHATGMVALAALTLALAACGDGPSGTTTLTSAPATPSGTATATATATPSPTGTSPSPTPSTAAPATETEDPGDDFSAAAQQSPDFPGGGGGLLPVAVRTGEHAGFDRVVFDFTGTGTPGWRVAHVDAAIDDPRGQEIDLDGDAVSEVVITGLRYPEESEYDTVLASGRIEVDDLDEVEEIHVSGIFEGQLQVLIGLEDEVPFRVFTLTDPVRLVIDYRTD